MTRTTESTDYGGDVRLAFCGKQDISNALVTHIATAAIGWQLVHESDVVVPGAKGYY